MTSQERREQIRQQLLRAEHPLSASALAEQLGVSRQIIVGDIALLRAGGFAVDATPRGYRAHDQREGCCRMLACVHDAGKGLRHELYAVVDNGGIVEDVAVENPLYGELRAVLHITNRYEADQFVQRAAAAPEGLLSRMTGGVHLHTILCADDAAFARIEQALAQAGVLYRREEP